MKGTDLFGMIGFISSIIYFIFSPIQFLFNLNKKNLNVEYISIFGLGNIYLTGILFFFYSVATSNRIEDYQIMEFCNLIGAIFLFIYIILYINFMYSGCKQFIYISIFILFSVLLCFVEYQLIKYSDIFQAIIFYIANAINVLMYLPVGFNILTIIKNKYPESLILNTSILGLINCISWLIFGIKSVFFDNGESKHIIIANIIGLSICIIQIILYYQFLKINPQKNDDINENLKYEEEEIKENKKNVEDKNDFNNMIESIY